MYSEKNVVGLVKFDKGIISSAVAQVANSVMFCKDIGGVLASTGVVVGFKEHVRDGYVTRL